MSQRDKSVDFAKGMLMLCVIYGHLVDALCGGLAHPIVWMHSFVRTFDMPFFMVISGYFLKCSMERKSACRVVLDRLTMLFVPIVVWTLLRGHLNVFIGMYYFLWAVLASSLICVVARCMASLCVNKITVLFEALLLIAVVILLHVLNIPWNLFYLFPFFLLGLYLGDLEFKYSRRSMALLFLVFVIGLCFWSPIYTPWHIGALAWKTNLWALLIYVYRASLALVGIIIMSNGFRVIMSCLDDVPYVRGVLMDAGTETLAIYILQTIVVERLIRIVCKVLNERLNVSFSDSYMNLLGYVIAPIGSFFILWMLLGIAKAIKRIPIVRYSFGFRYAMGH